MFVPAPSDHPGIPLHLLARQDIPILFYDEIPLFEDELGDNGIAELVVRVVSSELKKSVVKHSVCGLTTCALAASVRP